MYLANYPSHRSPTDSADEPHFIRDSISDIVTLIQRLQVLATDSPELAAALDTVDLDFLAGDVPQAVSQSIEGCQRVASIVRAMKDFSHPGQEMAPADLNRAILSTVMVATNEWKYVADIHTELDQGLSTVDCRIGEINQVILNMVINAAHSIADVVGDGSGKKGTITISTRAVNGFAEIRIADSGQGIAKQNLERIFDPFFTTKPVGRGTGQGLAIAHDVVVTKHGGSINVKSEFGKGSVFVISLPMVSRSLEAGKATA